MEHTQTIPATAADLPRSAAGYTLGLVARHFKTFAQGNESIALAEEGANLQPMVLEREVRVLNKLGLHARPAAEFVRAARSYKCTVTILKNGGTYSGSSILDVLSANLDCGSALTLRADGPDAEQAIERLAGLMVEFLRQEEGEGH